MYNRDNCIHFLNERSNFPTLTDKEYEIFSSDILDLIYNYDIILEFLYDNNLLYLFFNFLQGYDN